MRLKFLVTLVYGRVVVEVQVVEVVAVAVVVLEVVVVVVAVDEVVPPHF